MVICKYIIGEAWHDHDRVSGSLRVDRVEVPVDDDPGRVRLRDSGRRHELGEIGHEVCQTLLFLLSHGRLRGRTLQVVVGPHAQ